MAHRTGLLCKVIDRVRRLAKVSKSPDSQRKILDALQEMRFNKKPVDKIVLKLKDFVPTGSIRQIERSSTASREVGAVLEGAP